MVQMYKLFDMFAMPISETLSNYKWMISNGLEFIYSKLQCKNTSWATL